MTRYLIAAGAIVGVLGCRPHVADDGPETAGRSLNAPAPAPAPGNTGGRDLGHRLTNDPRDGHLVLPSEAQLIPPVPANQDPNPLPSNSREMGAAGAERDAKNRAEKARAPLPAPDAPTPPDPAVLAAQQRYLRAWQARRQELDAMDSAAREQALAALKRQFVKEGR